MKISERTIDTMTTALRVAVMASAVGALAFVSGGCFAPCAVNVNLFSSRMVQAQGTNRVDMAIEGGANLSSNTTTATMPLK
jgi:hypothetical protein